MKGVIWSTSDRDRILGCLLGGAVGDALGAPVEFLSLARIRATCGPAGVQDFEEGPWGRGRVTDDTQMILFTLEGLIRGRMRLLGRGRTRIDDREHDRITAGHITSHYYGHGIEGEIDDLRAVLYHAYLRRLITQGETRHGGIDSQVATGWLLEQTGLHGRRAPGLT